MTLQYHTGLSRQRHKWSPALQGNMVFLPATGPACWPCHRLSHLHHVTRDNKGCSHPVGRWATWKRAMRTWCIFGFDLKISAGKEGPRSAALGCFRREVRGNFQGFCWKKLAFSLPVKCAIYSVFILSSSSSQASQGMIASSHLYGNCLQ